MNVLMPDNTDKSKVRLQIDENLKRIYDETLQQQVPDHLMQLLAQLRAKVDGDAPAQTVPKESKDQS